MFRALRRMCQNRAGIKYVRKESAVTKAKRCLLLFGVLFLLLPAGGKAAKRYRVLDAALSMLEEGNPFLTRYNGLTGAGIEARFPLGCPYFWGGRNVRKILQPAKPGQSSDYYRTDQTYLYGLDCVGLTRWVVEQAGYAPHPSISKMLNRSQYKEYANYRADKTTGEARAEALKIGDLVAIQHASGGFHIAMYIGTLAKYGYTADELPEALIPYLHYPLLIHSTGSSDYHERYRKELEASSRTEVLPPFGGVIVTLLDAPLSAATSRTPSIPDLEEPCFDLEGYHLQITDLSEEKHVRWLRWREKSGDDST